MIDLYSSAGKFVKDRSRKGRGGSRWRGSVVAGGWCRREM